MNMQLTKHDYEMIADILDTHYEDTVEMQRNHYLNDDTDYFKHLEYLEELIDKVIYKIGSSEEGQRGDPRTPLSGGKKIYKNN